MEARCGRSADRIPGQRQRLHASAGRRALRNQERPRELEESERTGRENGERRNVLSADERAAGIFRGADARSVESAQSQTSAAPRGRSENRKRGEIEDRERRNN